MTVKDHMQLTAAEQIEQWRTRRKLLVAKRNLKRATQRYERTPLLPATSGEDQLAAMSQYVSRLREALP